MCLYKIRVRETRQPTLCLFTSNPASRIHTHVHPASRARPRLLIKWTASVGIGALDLEVAAWNVQHVREGIEAWTQSHPRDPRFTPTLVHAENTSLLVGPSDTGPTTGEAPAPGGSAALVPASVATLAVADSAETGVAAESTDGVFDVVVVDALHRLCDHDESGIVALQELH